MIVGLIGRRRVGKDVVAAFLHDHYQFTHAKFSTTLKKALCSLFDWSIDHVEGDQKDMIDPRWDISPRRAMQFFGTEVMQYKIQEVLPIKPREFFVKRLFMDLDTKPNLNVVISDVRFQHEIDAILTRGGITIKIKRVNPCVMAEDCHESETNIDNLESTYEVDNDATVIELREKIKNIMDNPKLFTKA